MVEDGARAEEAERATLAAALAERGYGAGRVTIARGPATGDGPTWAVTIAARDGRGIRFHLRATYAVVREWLATLPRARE